MAGLQFGECPAQRFCLVSADTLDEMHQRRLSAARVCRLVQGVDHQPGDQFIAAMHGRIAVGAIVPDLGHQVLLG